MEFRHCLPVPSLTQHAHSVPSSLEGYYQETGRAGRDGKSSTCVLYFSYADMRQHERFISDSQVSQEQKRSQREILNKVLTYCLNISDCRRTQVLQYFGEQFSPEQCNYTCDNCFVNKNSIPNKVDVTDKAKEILSLVKRMQTTNVSLGQVVDVYYGSKAKKVSLHSIILCRGRPQKATMLTICLFFLVDRGCGLGQISGSRQGIRHAQD